MRLLLCPPSCIDLTRKFLSVELRTCDIAETPHEVTIFIREQVKMVQRRLGVHSKFCETMPFRSPI